MDIILKTNTMSMHQELRQNNWRFETMVPDCSDRFDFHCGGQNLHQASALIHGQSGGTKILFGSHLGHDP